MFYPCSTLDYHLWQNIPSHVTLAAPTSFNYKWTQLLTVPSLAITLVVRALCQFDISKLVEFATIPSKHTLTVRAVDMPIILGKLIDRPLMLEG